MNPGILGIQPTAKGHYTTCTAPGVRAHMKHKPTRERVESVIGGLTPSLGDKDKADNRFDSSFENMQAHVASMGARFAQGVGLPGLIFRATRG